jgi:hypothetical protein
MLDLMFKIYTISLRLKSQGLNEKITSVHTGTT